MERIRNKTIEIHPILNTGENVKYAHDCIKLQTVKTLKIERWIDTLLVLFILLKRGKTAT